MLDRFLSPGGRGASRWLAGAGSRHRAADQSGLNPPDLAAGRRRLSRGGAPGAGLAWLASPPPPAARYGTLPPAQVRRLTDKLELHSTPVTAVAHHRGERTGHPERQCL